MKPLASCIGASLVLLSALFAVSGWFGARLPQANALENRRVAYPLHQNYVAGEVYRYRVTLRMEGNDSGDLDAAFTYIETTQRVKTDGSARIRAQLADATLKVQGIEIKAAMTEMLTAFLHIPSSVVLLRDRQGRVLDAVGKIPDIEDASENKEAGQKMEAGTSLGKDGDILLQIFTPLTIPESVRMGETWKNEFGPPQAGQETVPTMTTTLLGLEQVNGRETLKVKFRTELATVGFEGKKASYEGEGNVDAVTGRFVRLSSVLVTQSKLSGGAHGPGKFTLHVTLLPKTEKAPAL